MCQRLCCHCCGAYSHRYQGCLCLRLFTAYRVVWVHSTECIAETGGNGFDVIVYDWIQDIRELGNWYYVDEIVCQVLEYNKVSQIATGYSSLIPKRYVFITVALAPVQSLQPENSAIYSL
jgi:hypothetical protein